MFSINCFTPSTAEDVDKSIVPISHSNWFFVGGSGPNNYTKIQDAIDNASDGDNVFVFSGTYFEHVAINKSINLYGEDKNTTIIIGFVAYTLSFLCDWINMSEFTIRNSNNRGEGLRIDSSYNTFSNNIVDFPKDDVRIFGDINTFSNNTVAGEIIYLSGNNNTISGNTIKNINYGIFFSDSWDNIISNNCFIDSGLFFSDDTICNSTITNNTVNDKPLVSIHDESDLLIDVDAGQIILSNCTNINIKNQEINNTTVGIQILGSNNCVVSKNIITGSNYGICSNGWNNSINENIITNNNDAMRLSGNNNTISSNNISNNENAIYFDYSTNFNNIINNEITNNYCSIMFDYGSDFNNIINNIITNSYDALRLSGSNNKILNNDISSNVNGIVLVSQSNIISNNTIANNNFGVIIHDESNNVSGNTISKNNNGLILYGGSNSNNINNNTISNNYYAIKSEGDNWNNIINNKICDNIITNNEHGINLDANSSYNTIFQNSLINNTLNALDYGNNSWNSDKYGNYWDDYKQKYPNAHKILLKGIWDKPYDIPGGENKDNFPLIKPFNKPRNRIVNIFHENFIEHHTFLFRILKKILNK